MKTLHLTALAILSVSLISGCAGIGPYAGVNGVIYNDTTVPNYAAPVAGDATIGPRTGTASTHDVLGLASWGDAGTYQAARNGGVSQIKTIDVGTFNVLGLYSERTTKVSGYGEIPSPRATVRSTYQSKTDATTVYNDY